MEFLVHSTRYDCADRIQPCPKAYRKLHTSKANDKVTEIHGNEGWFVKLESLEELLEFQRSCKYPIILSDTPEGFEIEIYDYYRE